MIWDILNVAFALGITAFATIKLLYYYDDFKPIERGGLGIMAGSVLLTVPPLLTTAATPFDDWSSVALRLGIFLYLAGKVERLMRHARNNRRQIVMSRGWMKGRGE